MQKFTTLTGVAAPLEMINVDTDKIIPKQFLKTIKRSGLGKSLFFEMRYDDAGKEKPDSGEIVVGSTVKLGVVDQSRDALPNDKTAWEAISGSPDAAATRRRSTR